MKVCENCGAEIDGSQDGENECMRCEETESERKRAKARLRRKERDAIMRDLGLVKVRGALGGTYWE